MSVYLIFRVYSKKDKGRDDNDSVLYGWTKNKHVKDAYLSQRNPNKYKCIKVKDDVVNNSQGELGNLVLSEENAIDFIRLKFASTHEEFMFFTTISELFQAEVNIQRRFHEMSSLCKIDPNCKRFILMLSHLDKYYMDALSYIGYRPQEIDQLFDSADKNDEFSSLDKIEDQLEEAYADMLGYPIETYKSGIDIIGLRLIDDVSSKILYSVESFISVLKDDL